MKIEEFTETDLNGRVKEYQVSHEICDSFVYVDPKTGEKSPVGCLKYTEKTVKENENG